jgi:hypothetical protein
MRVKKGAAEFPENRNLNPTAGVETISAGV